MPRTSLAVAAVALVSLFASTAPALARPGGWGRPGFYGPGWGDPLNSPYRDSVRYKDPREGRIQTNHFVADGAGAELGHGPVSVTSQSGDGPWVSGDARTVFEAAVIDQLVHAGYDTIHAGRDPAQVTELRISRDVLVPAEEKRSPVSGSAAMSVGTYGSAYGLAVNVDMTKPRPALVSTRLEARILDKASGKVLWEGRASIATREGDAKWTEGEIATRLSQALFDGFPSSSS